MAARRLLIVMLILLGLSTLAAALIPPQSLRQGTDSTSSTETEQTEAVPDPLPDGKTVNRVIKVGDKKAEVAVVSIALGDQLALTVKSDRTGLIEIPKIGRVDPVAPGSPVSFYLLLDEPGSYAINFLETGRLVARIVVVNPAEARAASKKAPG